VKYSLEKISNTQRDCMIESLDLASRLHLGQLFKVFEFLSEIPYTNKVDLSIQKASENFLIEKYFGFSPNQNHGINSSLVKEDARIMRDMYDVLMYEKSNKKENYNPKKRSEEPLIEISKNDTGYIININEKQLNTLLPALDLYSRLYIGQTNMVDEYLRFNCNIPNKPYLEAGNIADKLLRKPFFGFELGQSFGITNPEVNESARVAFDMIQVIRHRLSWDREGNPEKRNWTTMLGVVFDEPMRTSESDLIQIKRVGPIDEHQPRM
jgi:hypothetical protein